MIQYSSLQTPIGELTVYAVEEGIIYITLPGSNSTEVRKWCAEKLGEDEYNEFGDWTKESLHQFKSYFRGERQHFNFPYLLITSSFRKKALMAVSKIPYGETRSYTEIARATGNPRAVRATGSANANNPLPIVIPCHRVITSSGNLGGYGGGLERKKWLLSHEQKFIF